VVVAIVLAPHANSFLSFLPVVLVGGLLFLIVRQFGENQRRAHDSRYCTQCGFVGEETEYRTGSTFIQILLYCFFIVPGVFYANMRSNAAYWGCPKCGAHNMIPLDSAAAKQALSTENIPETAPQSSKIASPEVRYCAYCGAQVAASSRYCGGCDREKIT
jgi:hypothetical protein